MTTRVGPVTFDVPQVREGGFYPEALERGMRTERALVTTLAEMYVQGVSTRKVAAVTEQLCGTAISSAQVSRAAALNEELSASRATKPIRPTCRAGCRGCGRTKISEVCGKPQRSV